MQCLFVRTFAISAPTDKKAYLVDRSFKSSCNCNLKFILGARASSLDWASPLRVIRPKIFDSLSDCDFRIMIFELSFSLFTSFSALLKLDYCVCFVPEALEISHLELKCFPPVSRVPGITIATDFICGFPTETEEVGNNSHSVLLFTGSKMLPTARCLPERIMNGGVKQQEYGV